MIANHKKLYAILCNCIYIPVSVVVVTDDVADERYVVLGAEVNGEVAVVTLSEVDNVVVALVDVEIYVVEVGIVFVVEVVEPA